MNWTRYKLLIVSGGITLVLSGVLIFWILSTGKTNAEIDQKISTLKQTQIRLTTSTPYPSRKNLAEMISENEKVTEYRNRIMESVREQQFEVPEINRSRFGDYVRGQWVPELRDLARNSVKGGGNGVILQDPAFGLQTYLDGALPESSQVPKLMLELQAKAHLSRLLFESGISELIVIKPIEEVSKTVDRTRPLGMGGPPPMMGGGGRPEQPVAEPAETRSIAEIEAARLFEWVPFRLEFRVYEDFYWDTLNRLLADPNQIVLTKMAVTNSNELLWPDYLKPVVSGASGTRARQRETRPAARERGSDMLALLQGLEKTETPEAESAGQSAILPGLAERRQNSVGSDLLNVVLDVKIYRLKSETPESTQGS